MKPRMIALVLTLITFSLFLPSQQANRNSQNADEVLRAKVRQIFELTEKKKSSDMAIDLAFVGLSQQMDVPKKEWDAAKERVKAQMLEAAVPIYLKYYTTEEIDTLIQFFNTPLGKKLIATTMPITQDLSAAELIVMKSEIDKMHERLSKKNEKP